MNRRNLTFTFALCLLLVPVASALNAQQGPSSAQQTGQPTKTTTSNLPACAPPEGGVWWVLEDCVMTAGPTGARTASSHVRVLPGVTLRLAPGATLDIDFAHANLRIGDGARVIIAQGASIR